MSCTQENTVARTAAGRRPGFAGWVKRLGLLGFLFFLVKGLLWLAVPALFVGRGCGAA